MRRKYRQGPKLSMRALTVRLLRQEYMFLGEKPMHPSFMGSMQFNTLSWKCRSGCVRSAIRNEE